MEKLIKISFDQDYRIIVETPTSREDFESTDDFLVWFVKYYSSSESPQATSREVYGSRQARTIRLLVFRGPVPYTKLRQLLTVCNLLSQIYKIPIAGYSTDGKSSKFGLSLVLPLYLK